ncbi:MULTISPECIES: TetR family transcriptional regulator [Arthrobacter]|uniref:TetR family transcriptional regulator n=2 Tax=Arthrobacter TaxID=1663 RepID=A0ABU9KFV8_9MICC|nr:TetR family transcriptional regulator [Arthrobacter sp. YJM1]MDP5225698.1 TetR family transcriptional regulator [Arthrobacter sp. YJM1]
MVSRLTAPRTRKAPAERRDEILRTAARIALGEGLELITVRRVAEELDVRPGLISHYFPSAEEMVSEAFSRAALGELETLLPRASGAPLERLRTFFRRSEGEGYLALSRLWLNARHTSRFRPRLQAAVEQQEGIMRDRLLDLVRDGVASGAFHCEDPMQATLEILVVIDGMGSYANASDRFWHPSLDGMMTRAAERVLGLQAGALQG